MMMMVMMMVMSIDDDDDDDDTTIGPDSSLELPAVVDVGGPAI
jgi:hypothetical protein